MAKSFLQVSLDPTSKTTYTFAAQNLGPVAPDRYIIVATTARKAGASTAVSSVTIGGVTATIATQTTDNFANTSVVSLSIALVPTGTTGDVVVTYGAAMARSSVALYRTTSLKSATAFHTQTSIVPDPTFALNVPALGFAIGVAVTGASETTTWSGLTTDYDNTGSSMQYSGGSQNINTAETGRIITATFSGTRVESAGVTASWESNPSNNNLLLMGVG